MSTEPRQPQHPGAGQPPTANEQAAAGPDAPATDFNPFGGRRRRGFNRWEFAMSDEDDGRFRGGRRGGRRGPGRHRHFDEDMAFFGGRGGQRAARGDIRTAILLLLGEQPMHGYQIIQELQDRSEGVWQPSAGSIYPRLGKLEHEGLIEAQERSSKKVFSLTEAGLTALGEVPEDKRTPWKDVSDTVRTDVMDMWQVFRSTADALKQVSRTGGAAQVEAATTLLTDTRRSLYRILSEDPE